MFKIVTMHGSKRHKQCFIHIYYNEHKSKGIQSPLNYIYDFPQSGLGKMPRQGGYNKTHKIKIILIVPLNIYCFAFFRKWVYNCLPKFKINTEYEAYILNFAVVDSNILIVE